MTLVLAVFLAGTNYCLAAALAGPGSRLACAMQTSLAPASDSGAPACHAALPPCHAAAAKGAKAPKTAAAPCCITLAPVSGSLDAKPAVHADAFVAVLSSATISLDSPALSDRGAPIPRDTGPPERPEASQASPRAPPLA